MRLFAACRVLNSRHGSARSRLALLASLALIMLALLAGIARAPVQAQGGAATPAAPVPAAGATRAVSDNEVNQIARKLYCPVCQNVPLEVCETEACARWREQVRDLLAQGYNESQVRQYFIERFGAKTVGAPSDPTAQILTVALPFGLIALVGVVVAVSLVRWRTRRAPTGRADAPPGEEIANLNRTSRPDATSTPEDYRARLEEEIRKRD